MSAEGFNRNFRPRRLKSHADFIVIHYDENKVSPEEVVEFYDRIRGIPERNRGTVFVVEPDGIFFRRV